MGVEAIDQASILIVDDTPANLDLLGRILSGAGYQIRKQSSGAMALTSAQAAPPDLILLDIKMPDMSGYRVCRQLKQQFSTAEIPIIFISALQDADDKVKAFESGAVDYISKPFHSKEVLARVATHLRLSMLQRRLEQQNRELERLATTDPLTGILNRRSFRDYGLHYLARASRYRYPFGLILFDIDEFKRINDRFGHDIGDKVLIDVTQSTRTQIRSVDLFARWGGEEFIILAPETPVEKAVSLAERLRECLERLRIDPVGTITASYGVSTGTESDTFEGLVREADIALLSAKEAGRNRVALYRDGLEISKGAD